jgi:hypothetical protein
MNDTIEISEDLTLKRIEHRECDNGSWIHGSLNGYRFCALTFPEHSQIREYELGSSRINLTPDFAIFSYSRLLA